MLKKWILLSALLAISAFMLLGCGNDDTVTDLNDFSGFGSDITLTDEIVTNENILSFVNLGQYLGVEFDAMDTSITDEEVSEFIRTNFSPPPELVEVEDRAVMNGDTVIVDFMGLLDGVAFDGGTAENTHLVIGSNMFIPGFEEQIIGHHPGETFDIYVTFPIPYHSAELEGQDVIFRITLHNILVEILPEVDDEFVYRTFGLETVEEFYDSIRANLEMQRELMAEESAMGQVWSTILESSTILMLPQSEITYMMERDMAQFENHAEANNMELSALILEISGLSVQDFIDFEVREAAIQDVTSDLVLRAIAAEEGIFIADEDFDEAVTRFTETFNYNSEEEFLEINGEHAVRIALLAERVIEFIMSHAIGV